MANMLPPLLLPGTRFSQHEFKPAKHHPLQPAQSCTALNPPPQHSETLQQQAHLIAILASSPSSESQKREEISERLVTPQVSRYSSQEIGDWLENVHELCVAILKEGGCPASPHDLHMIQKRVDDIDSQVAQVEDEYEDGDGTALRPNLLQQLDTTKSDLAEVQKANRFFQLYDTLEEHVEKWNSWAENSLYPNQELLKENAHDSLKQYIRMERELSKLENIRPLTSQADRHLQAQLLAQIRQTLTQVRESFVQDVLPTLQEKLEEAKNACYSASNAINKTSTWQKQFGQDSALSLSQDFQRFQHALASVNYQKTVLEKACTNLPKSQEELSRPLHRLFADAAITGKSIEFAKLHFLKRLENLTPEEKTRFLQQLKARIQPDSPSFHETQALLKSIDEAFVDSKKRHPFFFQIRKLLQKAKLTEVSSYELYQSLIRKENQTALQIHEKALENKENELAVSLEKEISPWKQRGLGIFFLALHAGTWVQSAYRLQGQQKADKALKAQIKQERLAHPPKRAELGASFIAHMLMDAYASFQGLSDERLAYKANRYPEGVLKALIPYRGSASPPSPEAVKMICEEYLLKNTPVPLRPQVPWFTQFMTPAEGEEATSVNRPQEAQPVNEVNVEGGSEELSVPFFYASENQNLEASMQAVQAGVEVDGAPRLLSADASPAFTLAPRTNEQIKEYLDQSQEIMVTKEIFATLFPKDFIETASGPKGMGNPQLWEDPNFDGEILEKLLNAFEEGRVKAIESDEGVFQKIIYSGKFEAELHKRSLDHDKSAIIAASFKNHFTHLSAAEQQKLEKTIIKYVDYIGVDQTNIRKILTKSDATADLFRSESSKKHLDQFLEEISSKMDLIVSKKIQMSEQEKTAAGLPLIDKETIIITTTSSGGAHLSIASVLQNQFTKRKIPHAIINESHLVKKDNLERFARIPRNCVFNKVSQQSQQMAYGKQLKKLDDYLNQFYPDQSSDALRGSVGNSTFLLSTSHHPDNVKVVAEHGKTIYFQVCDFGHLSEKLHDVARIVSKYSLSNIFFFVPSTRSTVRLSREAPESLPLAAPNTNLTALELPPELMRYKERYENYQRASLLTTYPVHEAFTHNISPVEIEQFKEKHHLRQDAQLWTMTMGSQGVGGILLKYIDQVIEGAIKDLQAQESLKMLDVIILCGANQGLQKELNAYYGRAMEEQCKGDAQLLDRLKNHLHFTSMPKFSLEEMAIIGRASDAFLSKPGGGTTAEALLGEMPMLIHREQKHFWEFGNIDELRAAGAEEINNDFYTKAKQAKRLKVLSSKKESTYDFMTTLWEQRFGKKS